MAKRPIIGISGSHNVKDRQLFLRQNYFDSVLRAGGLPVLLPQTHDKQILMSMVESMDGLLLAGGGDVLPAHYGEEMLPACGETDAQRDDFELALIPMVIEKQMPVFGICRGIQVLCVAMGGKLIQDICSQCGIPAIHHQQEPPYGEAVHTVRFEAGSLLEQITGVQEMKTNSMHHQAVRETGSLLRVDGYSEDGVIEAVSGVESNRIFAVQFHPEYLADHDVYCAKLFEHFVSLCKSYQEDE